MPTITTAGAIGLTPSALAASALSEAVLLSPGLTGDLPGSLVEDMNSTSAGSVYLMDQACVDLVNSVSPLTANPFIIKQLGEVYGVPQGVGSNTSVNVVFSGDIGFIINAGFVVSDGTYQYVTQDASVIGSSGSSASVYCLAILSGVWSVPANTVTTLSTSVPTGYTLTVTNPTAGTPQSSAQTDAEYQAQVIQAGQAVATGISTLVRTALGKISGVQARLVSFRQTGGGWQVLVGGGDPYEVANAIFQSMFNIADLKPASTSGATQTIAIYDYPDTYSIVFVQPALTTVGVTVTYNTTTTASYTSESVVESLAGPAIVAYVNSIYTGQPMSLMLLEDAFTSAVAGVIPEASLSKLLFAVTINGSIVTPPTNGKLITGDAESYFYTTLANIAVVKG